MKKSIKNQIRFSGSTFFTHSCARPCETTWIIMRIHENEKTCHRPCFLLDVPKPRAYEYFVLENHVS